MVAPVQVQVFVFKAKERFILALPVLQYTVLVALKQDHLHPVFYFRGPEAEVVGQTEETRLGGPLELLLLGPRVTGSQSY